VIGKKPIGYTVVAYTLSQSVALGVLGIVEEYLKRPVVCNINPDVMVAQFTRMLCRDSRPRLPAERARLVALRTTANCYVRLLRKNKLHRLRSHFVHFFAFMQTLVPRRRSIARHRVCHCRANEGRHNKSVSARSFRHKYNRRQRCLVPS
jgi:hypothetical protein